MPSACACMRKAALEPSRPGIKGAKRPKHAPAISTCYLHHRNHKGRLECMNVSDVRDCTQTNTDHRVTQPTCTLRLSPPCRIFCTGTWRPAAASPTCSQSPNLGGWGWGAAWLSHRGSSTVYALVTEFTSCHQCIVCATHALSGQDERFQTCTSHATSFPGRGHKEIITTLSRFPLDPNMFVSGELACALCVDEVWSEGCLKRGWVGRRGGACCAN